MDKYMSLVTKEHKIMIQFNKKDTFLKSIKDHTYTMIPLSLPLVWKVHEHHIC